MDYCYRQNSVVCLFFCRSVTVLSPAETVNRLRFRLRCRHWWTQGTLYWMGPCLHMWRGNFEGENIIWMANGWLKDQHQQFFCNGIRALDKHQTKYISVAGDYGMLKSGKVWCTYLVANCQSTNFLNAPCILCVYSLNLNLAPDQWRGWVQEPQIENSVKWCGIVVVFSPCRGNSINDQGWRGRLYYENHLTHKFSADRPMGIGCNFVIVARWTLPSVSTCLLSSVPHPSSSSSAAIGSLLTVFFH